MQFLLNTIDVWGYPAVFVGAYIEGLNVTLASSFFISQGIFSPLGIFLASASGNFLSDFMWYGLGRKYGVRALEKVSHVFIFFQVLGRQAVIKRIQTYFKEKGGIALVIAKFAIGPGIAAQITAGASGMSVKQFARLSIFANAVFTAVLIGIGYSFGEGYKAAARFMQNAGILIFIAILVVIAIELYGSTLFNLLLSSKKENGSEK